MTGICPECGVQFGHGEDCPVETILAGATPMDFDDEGTLQESPSGIRLLHSGEGHTGDPVIVLHVKDGDLPISPTNPAHAFGPFQAMIDAEAFHQEIPEPDRCHKIAVDLVGPGGDLDLERIHGALIAAGLVPPFGSRMMAEEIVQGDRVTRGKGA